jgi:predicted RNase H-like HicB family nuclease
VKTYYIVEEGGYRTGVKGRKVTLCIDLPLFQHKENNRYFVRCQRTSLCLGAGDTLKEAIQATTKTIEDTGIENLERAIKILEKAYGPKGGK